MLKKICVLAPNEINLDESLLYFYDIQSIPSLEKFVTRIKEIDTCEYMIIDNSQQDITDDDILKTITVLSKFTSIKIILIAQDSASCGVFLNSGLDVHIIYSNEDIISECEKITHGKRDLIKNFDMQNNMNIELLEKIKIPEDLKVHIGFTAIMPRIGLTTNIYALYNFLINQGFNPLIVDPLDNTFETEHFNISSSVLDGYNIYLHDLTFKTEQNMDFTFCVTGCKYSEVVALSKFDLSILPQNTKFLLSFPVTHKKEEIETALNLKLYDVPLFSDYVNCDGLYWSDILDIKSDILCLNS